MAMRGFFNCRSGAFGVTCVPRPEQLVRSTPLQPCGMPKDARKERGHVYRRSGGVVDQLNSDDVVGTDFAAGISTDCLCWRDLLRQRMRNSFLPFYILSHAH